MRFFLTRFGCFIFLFLRYFSGLCLISNTLFKYILRPPFHYHLIAPSSFLANIFLLDSVLIFLFLYAYISFFPMNILFFYSSLFITFLAITVHHFLTFLSLSFHLRYNAAGLCLSLTSSNSCCFHFIFMVLYLL